MNQHRNWPHKQVRPQPVPLHSAETKTLQRLSPDAKVWTRTLVWLYGHLAHSAMKFKGQELKGQGYDFGANVDRPQFSILDLTHSEGCPKSHEMDFLVGFDWKMGKPPEELVRKHAVGLVRVIGLALIRVVETGLLTVDLTDSELQVFGGIPSGRYTKEQIASLVKLLSQLAYFRFDQGEAVLTKRFQTCRRTANGCRLQFEDRNIGGEFAGGISQHIVGMVAANGTLDPTLSREMEIALGFESPTTEERQAGLEKCLSLRYGNLSAPRLLHSGQLRLDAREEALYAWVERNLTLIGPAGAGYKCHSLPGQEGRWLAALGNFRGNFRPRGFRIGTIVQDCYFPASAYNWNSRQWYNCFAALMRKLGGVIMIKFSDGSLVNSDIWDGSPTNIASRLLFPFLPLSWLRELRVQYDHFKDQAKCTKISEYRGIMCPVSAAIKQKRKSLRMTQQELAGLLSVSLASVKAWEAGKRRPEHGQLWQWLNN